MSRSRRVRQPVYRYTAVFEPAEEGGYTVTVPALPGIVSEGDTLAEARTMVRDAIRGYLESLQKEGSAIPTERRVALTKRIPVKLPGPPPSKGRRHRASA